MSRRMSFSMTTPQFLDGSKTVTRRMGWKSLEAGARCTGIEKGMGLKKGEKQVVLGELEIVSVRRERLDAIDQADVIAEGFPDLDPAGFVRMFCKAQAKCTGSTEVTRIEFRRVATHRGAPKCPRPDCGAPCGTLAVLSIAPGDLRCACCGCDWTPTAEEMTQARAADAAWETEQRRQEAPAPMKTKRKPSTQLKLALTGLAMMLACTPIQARTARDVGAGAGALACAVAGFATGQPWAEMVGAIGCALERLLARRGTMEAANVAQIPLLEALTELELAYDRAKRTGFEADALAAEAARVTADQLAVEYWGTP